MYSQCLPARRYVYDSTTLLICHNLGLIQGTSYFSASNEGRGLTEGTVAAIDCGRVTTLNTNSTCGMSVIRLARIYQSNGMGPFPIIALVPEVKIHDASRRGNSDEVYHDA
jgi:hypothetical protein